MLLLEEIQKLSDKNDHCDYYAFPENIVTFAHSKPNSRFLAIVRGGNTYFLRSEKTQAILIHAVESLTTQTYKSLIAILKEKGFSRFGTLLTFQESPVYDVKGKVWMTTKSWEQNDISNGTKHNIRNYLKRFTFYPVNENNAWHMHKVLDNWKAKAKDRHFMLVIGHYKSYIDHYFKLKNSRLFFMKHESSRMPCGMIGGYIDPELNQAVTVQAKHDYTQKGSADALWAFWLDYIHNELGITLCNNGDTSDALKKKFGMTPKMAYRTKRISIKESQKPNKSLEEL